MVTRIKSVDPLQNVDPINESMKYNFEYKLFRIKHFIHFHVIKMFPIIVLKYKFQYVC